MHISILYSHLATLHGARACRCLAGNTDPTTTAATGHPTPGSQLGFANLEFLIVALPLLMTAAGVFEISRWHMTREIVSVALLQAARAGSMNHTHPQAIQQAFEAALTPLYAPAGGNTNPQARMRHRIQQLESRSGQPAWRITIAHPNALEFHDFRQDDLPIARKTGMPAINNNYQYEQDRQLGVGRASGATIYAANTLQLNVVYHYEPVVPGFSLLLRTLFGTGKPASASVLGLGLLPIRSSIAIEMQSHPVFWQSGTNAHVAYATTTNTQVAATTVHRPAPDAATYPEKPPGDTPANPPAPGRQDHATPPPPSDPAKPTPNAPSANPASSAPPGEQTQGGTMLEPPETANPENALAPATNCAT